MDKGSTEIRGMILAAGYATRLGEIAQSRPKALLDLGGITLIEQAVNKLMMHGVDEIIVNIHHFPDMIRDYVESRSQFGAKIVFSDETDKLLNTGGGIMKAEWFLKDCDHFVVYNVDVISNIDLNAMIDWHRKAKALATLAVRNRHSSRVLLFDENNLLKGWKHTGSGETLLSGENTGPLKQYAFSGIHVVSPDIFRVVKKRDAFQIVPMYIGLAENQKILAYCHDADEWMDAGTKEQVPRAMELLKKCTARTG